MSVAVKNEFISDSGDTEQYMAQLGRHARAAAEILAHTDPEAKNEALLKVAEVINQHRKLIKAENQKDMRDGELNGLDAALLDRLLLSDARIDAMIEGLRQIVSLPDPVGEISELEYRPSGIQVGKMRVPLGVIGRFDLSGPHTSYDSSEDSGNHG